MERSSLRIPPVWKHDEHITTLWVNRGPPSFTLSLSWALHQPLCLPLPLSHTRILPLSLSQTCGYSYISGVFVTASCVCWAAFTRPPPPPHPSTPLSLWPRQPHLPTQTRSRTHSSHLLFGQLCPPLTSNAFQCSWLTGIIHSGLRARISK